MGKSIVKLDGKVVIERDVGVFTPEQIRAQLEKRVGSDRRIMIRRGSEARPLDQFPPNFNLGTEVIAKDYPASTAKGAMSQREHYIKSQVASVAEVYGERYGQTVQLDEKLRFVVIPCFTL